MDAFCSFISEWLWIFIVALLLIVLMVLLLLDVRKGPKHKVYSSGDGSVRVDCFNSTQLLTVNVRGPGTVAFPCPTCGTFLRIPKKRMEWVEGIEYEE